MHVASTVCINNQLLVQICTCEITLTAQYDDSITRCNILSCLHSVIRIIENVGNYSILLYQYVYRINIGRFLRYWFGIELVYICDWFCENPPWLHANFNLILINITFTSLCVVTL